MIVYIDQLFAVNFAADFIILHIACGFSCVRKHRFTLLAAIFGGIYGAFMCFPRLEFFYHPIFRMVFAVVMVAIAARPKSFIAFIRSELIFSAVASMLGGGVLAILTMMGYSLSEVSHNSISVFNVPSVLLITLLCGLLFFGKIACTVLFGGARVKNKLVKLTVFACGKKKCVTGLVDTGCNLRNPSGQEPVIIINYDSIKDIVKSVARVCIIPYSTVNGSGSFLGFKPDFVEIDKIRYRNVVIAVRYPKVAKDGMYSAIINADIFKEGTEVA